MNRSIVLHLHGPSRIVDSSLDLSQKESTINALRVSPFSRPFHTGCPRPRRTVVNPVIHRLPEKGFSPCTRRVRQMPDRAGRHGDGFCLRGCIRFSPALHRLAHPPYNPPGPRRPSEVSSIASPATHREQPAIRRLPPVISSKDSPGVWSGPSEDGRYPQKTFISRSHPVGVRSYIFHRSAHNEQPT